VRDLFRVSGVGERTLEYAFRLIDRGSVNPSPLGDGSQCKDELFSNNYPGYEKLNSFSLRDACMDAGVRAQHGALAGKVRMRGYESGRNTYDLIRLSALTRSHRL
jgi:hypothetical protein